MGDDRVRTDPFDRALRMWEADRRRCELFEQSRAIYAECTARVQPIKDEIRRIEAATYPEDFHDATSDANLNHEYWLLRRAGIASWDALREATDEELLAIQGIGPAKLKLLREFAAASAE